jgi:hypothetical protein
VDQPEHVKTVYAHFGLAVYLAQVLEHGIVNALVVSKHIPNKLGSYSSQQEWEAAIDGFMDGQFSTKTLGPLIGGLKTAIEVPPDFEAMLGDALRRRNWLVHHYFRERATELMTSSGRGKMIDELMAAQQLLSFTDQALDQVIRPIRERYGISDEAVQAVLADLVASHSE